MTIASAITAAQGRVANAYTAVGDMGGTLPATENLANLPAAIRSISTINNEDITVTSNGTYTASSGYTGLGEVTVNVPEPDIVTATNTTGASIAEGDKVWLEKVAGGYNAINFINAKNKITLDKVGTTEVALLAQGFSTSNRLYMPTTTIPDFDAGNCTTYIKIKVGASRSQNFQSIYAPGPQTVNLGISGNSDNLAAWSNSTQTSNIIARLSRNTWYWIKAVCNGTSRSVSISTDGVNYTTPVSYTDENVSGNTLAAEIGGGSYNTSWYFLGQIDLSEFYITNAAGKVVWRAAYDGIMTGFAQENIATSGTGSVKTALGGYIDVEVEVDADNAEITVA